MIQSQYRLDRKKSEHYDIKMREIKKPLPKMNLTRRMPGKPVTSGINKIAAAGAKGIVEELDRMKKKLAACLLALAMATAFSGCKGRNAAQNSAGSLIRIGFIGPLTGSASSCGQSSRKGLQLLEDQINRQGGISGKKVKIIYADDKGNAAVSVNEGKKLIGSDKVAAIIGPVTSTCADSLAPLCQKSNIPMITGTDTHRAITNIGDCIFRTCLTDTLQGKVMAKFAAGYMKVQTAAVFYESGNSSSADLAEAFAGSFTGKVVDTETYSAGAGDFKAQLTKIKQHNPEVLFLPESSGDAAAIAREARSMGITSTFLGGSGFDTPEFLTDGGGSANGVYFSSHYSAEDTSGQVAQFLSDFQAKYHSKPDVFAALTYDAGKVLCDSIQKAGSIDADAVKNALKSYDGNLICGGRMKFDDSRSAVKAAFIIKTIDGRATLYKKLTA